MDDVTASPPDPADDLSFLHPVRDIHAGLEHACPGRPQHPLHRVSPDISRNAGIGNGHALFNDPAQMVAPVGLDDQMDIPAGRESRTAQMSRLE